MYPWQHSHRPTREVLMIPTFGLKSQLNTARHVAQQGRGCTFLYQLVVEGWSRNKGTLQLVCVCVCTNGPELIQLKSFFFQSLALSYWVSMIWSNCFDRDIFGVQSQATGPGWTAWIIRSFFSTCAGGGGIQYINLKLKKYIWVYTVYMYVPRHDFLMRCSQENGTQFEIIASSHQKTQERFD